VVDDVFQTSCFLNKLFSPGVYVCLHLMIWCVDFHEKRLGYLISLYDCLIYFLWVVLDYII
jgi:hypothetical protein